MFSGGSIVPQHQAAGWRAVHAQQLRHAQVRDGQLGHRRQWIQAHRHRRQGP